MTNIKTLKFIFFIFSFFFLTASQVFAIGAGITYNGRILNPNGEPVQGNSVQFKLQIRTIGSENCLMYEEVQVKDMSGSDGVFTLTINDGSGTRLDSAAYGLDQIFANRGTFSFPTNYCASGNSYAPNPSDGRKLQVYFNDGTIPAGEWEPSPAMAINFIPSAIEAMQVGGYKKEQLLKLADGVSTTGSELDATKWTNLQALLAGSSSQYVTPGSATFTAAPSWSGTPSVGTDLVNKTYVDAQVSAGLPDVGTPGTYGKVTTDAKGRVTSGAALVEADIPTLSTAGKVSGSAINTGTVGGNAAINTTGNLVSTGTVSGQTLSATQLRVYNGSNYLQFTSPTLSGITNFILPPGDSTGTQYLRSDGAGNLSWGSPGSGSGTVNSGSANQLAYYAGAGSAVSGLSTANNGVLVTSGAGAPSISSTLPSAVQTNITSLGSITSGTWNGTAIAPQYGGTGINASSAANGTLAIGNGSGFTLANLTQAANQGVTITNGSGSIALGTAQDIRTTASPTFAGMILNNVATNLTQSVSVGTSYGITWPGSVASTAGSVLTSTTGGLLSWTAAVPAANGGTGQSSYTIGDLLYASTSSALSRLPASTSGYVLTSNGAGTAPSWQAAAGGGAISALTAAASTNSIDNTNYAQTWNWSTATTENPMVLTANALTTGSLLSVSTSNSSLNSTNGLLNVANTGASTSGVLARLQSSSTAGSGLTVLANGNVGIGTATPDSQLVVSANSGTLPTLPSPSVARFVAANSISSRVGIETYGSGAIAPTLRLLRANGTAASPSAVLQSDYLGQVSVGGYTGTTFNHASAGLVSLARENWSGSANGSLLWLFTTPTGSTTSLARIVLGSDGSMGFGGTITDSWSYAGAAMVLDSSGRLGIGTTTPSSALEVSGDITVSKNVGGRSLNIANTNVDGENATSFYINGAHANGATAAQGGGIHLSSGTGKLTGNGGTLDLSAGTSGNGGAGGPVNLLGGNASGGSSTAGGAVNIQGGLGKTTGGAVNILGGFTNTAGSSSPAGNVNITGGQSIAGNNNGGSIFLNGGTKSGTGSVGNIIMGNIGGNVGIGTATPTSALDVGNGQVKAGSFSSGPIGLTVNGVGQNNTFLRGISSTTDTTVLIGSASGGVGGYINLWDATITQTVRLAGSGDSYLNGGNVGIGTASPGAKLDVTDASTTTSAIIVPRAGTFTGTTVNGMIRYNTTSTLFEFYQNGGWVNYTTVSDGRLKTNVIPITDGLSIVRQLNPVFYDWDRSNPKTSSFEDKHQVGFIAQEVEEVFPEVVNQGEDSYRSLEYGKIVSVAIAAIKELYNKILDIKSDVEDLKAKDAAKDREIASVKAENADLKVKAQKAEEENAALKVRLDKIEKKLNLK